MRGHELISARGVEWWKNPSALTWGRGKGNLSSLRGAADAGGALSTLAEGPDVLFPGSRTKVFVAVTAECEPSRRGEPPCCLSSGGGGEKS